MKPQWWVSCKPLADEAIKVRCSTSLVLSFLLTSRHWYSVRDRVNSSLHQSNLRMIGTGGWRQSRIGAFRDSCGGATVARRTLLTFRGSSKTHVTSAFYRGFDVLTQGSFMIAD